MISPQLALFTSIASSTGLLSLRNAHVYICYLMPAEYISCFGDIDSSTYATGELFAKVRRGCQYFKSGRYKLRGDSSRSESLRDCAKE